MPRSHSLYSELDSALESCLAEEKFSLSYDDTDGCSLLLLTLARDIAGFVMIDSAPASMFEVAYSRFKHLYRERHAEWHTKTLSFVLCRVSQDMCDDEFLNRQLNDVFFCRKYMIDLSRAGEGTAVALRQLPFVPLESDGKDAGFRPPSAQTVLQRVGVPADLARQVVVPREASEATIIDRLVDGTIPHIHALQQPPSPRRETDPARAAVVRIKKLTIEDFRAYRGVHQFDLDADIIVLYGMNGLGKTSLFDAIDFASTGRIGRFCRQRISPERFVHLARHLDAEHAAGTVTLTLDGQPHVKRLARSLSDWNTALVDGNPVSDRRVPLQLLSCALWPEEKARVENLERLFRATHLFGQHDRELLADFLQDSAIHADLITRMLSLDDYADARRKMSRVQDEVGRRQQRHEETRRALELVLRTHEEELARLPSGDAPNSLKASLQKEAIELRESMLAIAGIELGSEPLDPSVMHDCRSRLTALADECRNRLEQTISVGGQLRQIEQTRKDREEATRREDELSTQIRTLQAGIEECTNEAGALELSARNASRRVAEATTERDRLLRVRHMLVEMDSRTRHVAELTTRLLASQSAHRESQLALQALSKEQEERRERARLLQEKRPPIVVLATTASDLTANWNRVQEDRAGFRQLSESIPLREADATQLKLRLEETRHSHERSMEDHARVAAQRRQVSVSEEDSALFLEQAELRAKGHVCPACGADHRSHEELVRRIRERKAANSTQEAEDARRLQEGERQVKQLSAAVANKEAALRQQLDTLQEEVARRTELRQRIDTYEASARTLGLTLEGDQAAAALAHCADGLAQQLDELDQGIGRIEVETAQAAGAIERRTRDVERERQAEADADELLRQARQDVERLEKEVNTGACESPRALDALREEILRSENAIESAQRAVEDISRRQEELRTEKESLKQKLERVRQEHARITSEHVQCDEQIIRFESRLAALDIPRESQSDDLGRRTQELEERSRALDALRKQVRFLETALDAAAASARAATLKEEIANITTRVNECAAKTQRMQDIREVCDKMTGVLKTQTDRSTESHIRSHGPLTTILERRLRSVYGFEPVTLQASEGKVHVRVGRRGQVLKPTDYFSDSQVQILMLSLFLAARLTQTWSSFAPIMMDDPVTHFDDLNAYAFVELIRGIAERSPGERQFIISTCEERLFQLFKEKLSALDRPARIYRFTSIGQHGPVAEQVS